MQTLNKAYIDDLVSRLVTLVNDNLMMRATIQRQIEKINTLEILINNYKNKENERLDNI
jgi:hypothetical protein